MIPLRANEGERPMLIAQITDLHVVGNGQLCQGRVATNAQLQEAVAHINRLDPRPDVVLATGDLTDHGTAEEYDALRGILTALLPPLYLIPGNHDHRDVFLEAFADHAYLPRPGAPFAHYVIEEYPVRLVGLDTTIPGQSYGMLCDERLAWLDATLQCRAAPADADLHAPSPLPHRYPLDRCDRTPRGAQDGGDGGTPCPGRMGRLWAHSPPDPGGVGWYYCLHGAEHLPRAGGLNFSRDERLRLRVCSRATGCPALSAGSGVRLPLPPQLCVGHV